MVSLVGRSLDVMRFSLQPNFGWFIVIEMNSRIWCGRLPHQFCENWPLPPLSHTKKTPMSYHHIERPPRHTCEREYLQFWSRHSVVKDIPFIETHTHTQIQIHTRTQTHSQIHRSTITRPNLFLWQQDESNFLLLKVLNLHTNTSDKHETARIVNGMINGNGWNKRIYGLSPRGGHYHQDKIN